MAGYFVRRTLAALIAVFIILVLAFCATRLMPGNAYDDPELDPEVAAAMRARAHLDKPIYVQLAYFLRAVALENDWGVSAKVEPGTPVFRVLARRIPTSLSLNLIALLLALPLGLALGAASALKPGKSVDAVISVAVVVCVSVPSFVVAAVLQYIFAYKLSWFPLIYEPSAGIAQHARSMALPVIALMFHPVAATMRYLRGELVEIAPQEYIALARTLGLTRTQALLRHGLRNAAIPMMSIILPMLANLIGGSMVIERMFSIAGVGGTMISAIASGDHALTVASLTFYAAISVAGALLIDISYGIIDPRVRVGERAG